MLHELQSAFRTAVLGGDPAAAERLVVTDAISAADRVLIYRNNAQISLAKVLASDFPVTERIVGEKFFREMARQFVFAHPPKRPELLAYGDAFPAFVAAFPPAHRLAYLGDVAALEAAAKQAFFAADADPIAPMVLADAAAGDPAALRFDLHPSLRIVRSDHPILTIHRANRADRARVGPVDLSAQGETVLVARVGADLTMDLLDAGAAAFLFALAAAQPLGQAATAAQAAKPDFDLQACLADCLARGLFAQVHTPATSHTTAL